MAFKTLTLQAVTLTATTSGAWLIDTIALSPDSVTATLGFYKIMAILLILRFLIDRSRGFKDDLSSTVIGFSLAFILTDPVMAATQFHQTFIAAFWVLFGEQSVSLARQAMSSPENAGATFKFLRGLMGRK